VGTIRIAHAVPFPAGVAAMNVVYKTTS